MPEPTFWLVFFSAALALNVSPGPDLLFVLSRTLSGGRRVGVASVCGVCSGALVHVAAAALGISAIMATSALAFAVVKYVGAAYLLYLGVQALRSAGATASFNLEAAPKVSVWQAYVKASSWMSSTRKRPFSSWHFCHSSFDPTMVLWRCNC